MKLPAVACRYYGKSHAILAATGLLRSQHGNECAVIFESFSPCQMEIAGEVPAEARCSLAQEYMAMDPAAAEEQQAVGHPYGSLDVAHVRPPNPEDLWKLAAGEVKSISPVISFELIHAYQNAIKGFLTVGRQRVEGSLFLDKPVVCARNREDRRPCITLTLRKIEDGCAYIQVTYDPTQVQEIERSN